MNNLHVCITGANGFIGRSLVDTLTVQGYSIRVLTRRHASLFPEGVQVIIGDLTSSTCPLVQFLTDCDVLFHCAGEIHDVMTMHKLHIEGTERLLKAVLNVQKQTGRKIHWIQLSSVGAYGPPQDETKKSRIVTEATTTRHVGNYEITKTKSDELIIQKALTGSFTYTIVRPSNIVGPNMTNQSLRGLIQMVKCGLFFYVGKPGAVATYIHVDDVVSALITCAINPHSLGHIYNLSSDCSLEDLINCIASFLGVRPPWLRFPESIIRLLITLFKGRVNLPLTISRIDALVNRTRYPADQIVYDLGFQFSKPMPLAIGELVSKFS